MLNLSEIDISEDFVDFFNNKFTETEKAKYLTDSCSNLEKDILEHTETSYNKEHLTRSIGHMLLFINTCCKAYGIDTKDVQQCISAKISGIEEIRRIETEFAAQTP